MTSETGKGRKSGFTLLEILLVLLLLVGISSLFVANIDVVFREEDEASVENAFWEASREARLQALYSRRPVIMRYDMEEGAFFIGGSTGGARSFAASGKTREGQPIQVNFVQERPRNEAVLIRGQLIDTRPLDQVVFYPDGTCTSFWLEIAVGDSRRQIRIDPWTGAEMLTAVEE